MAGIKGYDTALARALNSVDPVGTYLSRLTVRELVEYWEFLETRYLQSKNLAGNQPCGNATPVKSGTIIRVPRPSPPMFLKTEEASGPLSGNKPTLKESVFRNIGVAAEPQMKVPDEVQSIRSSCSGLPHRSVPSLCNFVEACLTDAS